MSWTRTGSQDRQKEVIGGIKEATGKAVGDAKLTADGKAEKVEGKVQNAIGRIKDALKQ